jgi:hypothetical protein
MDRFVQHIRKNRKHMRMQRANLEIQQTKPKKLSYANRATILCQMNNRFYWPWQLAARPDFVAKEGSNRELSEWKGGLVDIHRDSLLFTQQLIKVILRLMGYTEQNSRGVVTYYHPWVPNNEVVVSTKRVDKKDGSCSFFCSVQSTGSCSTVQTVSIANKDPLYCSDRLVCNWTVVLVQSAMQRLPMPRPRQGCMILVGEDFGSSSMEAFFRYDAHFLQAVAANVSGLCDVNDFVKRPLYIDGPVQRYMEENGIQAKHITSFSIPMSSCGGSSGGGGGGGSTNATKSEDVWSLNTHTNLMEYIVVEHQSKAHALALVSLFFSLGYTTSLLLYCGHGELHTGNLVLRAATPAAAGCGAFSTVATSSSSTGNNNNSSNNSKRGRTRGYETISYCELEPCMNAYARRAWVPRVPPPPGFGEALLVMNSCYAHLFAPAPLILAEPSASASAGAGMLLLLPPPPPSPQQGSTTVVMGRCKLGFIALSQEDRPRAPSGGCIKYFLQHPGTLPELFVPLLPHIQLGYTADARDTAGAAGTGNTAKASQEAKVLPSMYSFMIFYVRNQFEFHYSSDECIRSEKGPRDSCASRRVTAQQQLQSMCKLGATVPGGPASGVYLFTDQTYVVLDALSRHAVLVGSGSNAQLFYLTVWRDFIVPHVDTFEIVVANAAETRNKGVYALVCSKAFQSRQQRTSSSSSTSGTVPFPFCTRLSINFPRDAELMRDRSSYSDSSMIVKQAVKAGVPVAYSVTAGSNLYSAKHRTRNGECDIRIDVLSPAAHSTSLQRRLLACTDSLALPSRLRGRRAAHRKESEEEEEERKNINFSSSASNDLALVSGRKGGLSPTGSTFPVNSSQSYSYSYTLNSESGLVTSNVSPISKSAAAAPDFFALDGSFTETVTNPLPAAPQSVSHRYMTSAAGGTALTAIGRSRRPHPPSPSPFSPQPLPGRSSRHSSPSPRCGPGPSGRQREKQRPFVSSNAVLLVRCWTKYVKRPEPLLLHVTLSDRHHGNWSDNYLFSYNTSRAATTAAGRQVTFDTNTSTGTGIKAKTKTTTKVTTHTSSSSPPEAVAKPTWLLVQHFPLI